MNAQLNPEIILLLLSVSVVYLLLVFLLLRRFATFESKLLTLGLLTALLAVWCGQAGQVGAGVHVGAGAESGRVLIGGDAAGVLGRIAFLLVLGGVAISVCSRCGNPSVPTRPEEAGRANAV
jgi:hypothetical protein